MKLIVLMAAIVLNFQVLGYGVGSSTSYPYAIKERALSAEFTGITSGGGGVGVQARYIHKLYQRVTFDAGFGIAAGEHTNRFFIGTDYEIFPDYMKQPRFSTRFQLENASEFDDRRTILTIAPSISKGFNFWGTEAFPFISLPIGLNLNGDSNTYETQINLSLGASGNLPISTYRKLIASAEFTVGLKDSLTAVLFGLSYPL